MVRAFHLVITTYGFWLPNDPRGSWSDFVRSFELYRVGGPATRVHTKASLAHRPHDHDARRRTKHALKRDPVVFIGLQARAVVRGLADYTTKNNRVVYACAVMPNHIHLVVARCEKPIETIAKQLKARATMLLNQEGLHPIAGSALSHGRQPSPWARGCWSVFLRSDEQIARAIHYVEQNPVNAGYKPQRYNWVTEFKG